LAPYHRMCLFQYRLERRKTLGREGVYAYQPTAVAQPRSIASPIPDTMERPLGSTQARAQAGKSEPIRHPHPNFRGRFVLHCRARMAVRARKPAFLLGEK